MNSDSARAAPAGYGLRRQLVDRDRSPKEILSRGEQKSIQTDRIILIPDPENELRVVRETYDLFTQERKLEREIASLLDSRGLLTVLNRPWTRATVHQMLTNPKYAGGNVYNRRSFKLKRKRVNNPPEMWIRRDDTFTPLITFAQFNEALTLIQSRSIHLSNEQFLDGLKALLARVGTLSGILIDEADDMPSSTSYRYRFGSLIQAYTLIGYPPLRDFSYVEPIGN